jgi:hypothetical protein
MFKPVNVLYAMACLLSADLAAQQTAYPVWRCGPEFTNQPRPGENCQQVDLPAEITMTAPRKRPNLDKNDDMPPVLVVPQVGVSGQRQRDGLARNILNDELGKLLLRCTQLPANSTELVRCLADEAALRRELARMP